MISHHLFQTIIGHTLRDLVCIAILALSCTTQAFVLSSRQIIDITRRGYTNYDQQQGLIWRRLPATTTITQLNVMQVPPKLRTPFGLHEEEGGESEEEEAGYSHPRYLVEEAMMASFGGNSTFGSQRNGGRPSRKRRTTFYPEVVVEVLNQKLKDQNGDVKRLRKRATYVAETKLPSEYGQFMMRGYQVPGEPIGNEPCVIYPMDKPPMGTRDNMAYHVPVRIHDQCLTSEVFGSRRCDCKEQLVMALDYIQKFGGAVIYLQQEGRGIGLANKIAAYELQDRGFDTVDANLHLGFEEDEREYDIIPSILEDLNIAGIRLMTNNPRKVDFMTDLGVNVEGTIPMVVPEVNQFNRKYIETKRERMSHANFGELLSKNGGEPLVSGDSRLPSIHMMTRRGTIGARNGVLDTPEISKASCAMQLSMTMQDAQDVVHSSAVNGDYGASDSVADYGSETEEGVVSGEDGYCFGRESVEAAISAIARGGIIVVVDDMDRENEGDFIMAADLCAPLDMAHIIRYSSGVVCVALEEERLEELKLPAMVALNEDPKGTAFTVTVDANKDHGITTGISAAERAITIQLLANPKATAVDFHRPGHVLPLRARKGGVLTRDGHTEAAIDFAKLANRQPAGVLCEIVSEENPTEMMRLPEIKRFCARHGHVLTSIADLAQYRRDTGL